MNWKPKKNMKRTPRVLNSIRYPVLAIVLTVVSGAVTRAIAAPSSPDSPRRLKVEKTYQSKGDYESDRHAGKGWIEVRSQGLMLRGSKGEIKMEIQLDLRPERRPESASAKPAKNGEAVLIEKVKYQDREGTVSRWDVYRADGARTKLAWENSGEVWPAPDGQYFVGFGRIGYNSDGRLRFFGADGALIKEIAAFDWGARQARIVFSDDGEFGAYLQTGEKFSPEAGRAKSVDEFGGVAVFDRRGNIVGRLERPNWPVVGPSDGEGNPLVRILSSARKLVLVRGDPGSTVDGIGFDGSLEWSVPARAAKGAACRVNLAVSSDGRAAALLIPCETKSHLKILSIESGKPTYSGEIDVAGGQLNLPWKPVTEQGRARFHLTPVGGNFAVAYSRAKRGSSTKATHGLILVNGKGKKLDEVELEEPVDAVDSDDDSLILTHGSRLVKWHLQESR